MMLTALRVGAEISPCSKFEQGLYCNQILTGEVNT